jgi:hypothetical protein
MATRDVGDRQNIELLVYTPFADPPTLVNATVALSVTDPAGAITSPSVTNASTGTYQASFTLATAGVWYWRWTVSGTVVDISDGQVTAVDPSPPAYASLDQLKGARKTTTTDRDDDMSQALLTAARRIDKTTGDRQFWLDKTVSARIFRMKGRVYSTDEGEWLIVDDIGSLSGLVVEVGDGTTWTAVTGYQTGPENALAKRQPINRLLRPVSSWSGSWSGPNQARITARWGWPAVPDEIVRANLLQANRLYTRKDSPDGVLGNAEWGVTRVSSIDPDVRDLIADYCLAGMG